MSTVSTTTNDDPAWLSAENDEMYGIFFFSFSFIVVALWQSLCFFCCGASFPFSDDRSHQVKQTFFYFA
jgi:hypothetical protein